MSAAAAKDQTQKGHQKKPSLGEKIAEKAIKHAGKALLRNIILAALTGGTSLLFTAVEAIGAANDVMEMVAAAEDVLDTIQTVADTVTGVIPDELQVLAKLDVKGDLEDKVVDKVQDKVEDQMSQMKISEKAAVAKEDARQATPKAASNKEAKISEKSVVAKSAPQQAKASPPAPKVVIDPAVAKELKYFVKDIFPKISNGKKQLTIGEVIKMGDKMKELCPTLAEGSKKRIIHCSVCGLPGKNKATHDKHAQIWREIANAS